MATEGKSTGKYAWHSTCLLCKAVLDFVYTLGVGFLALLICLFAYVISIEETDMPEVLVTLLEKELHAQGASLTLSGIRIKPNGRITIDNPVIHSTDLDCAIAAADRIRFKVDPALFLFGRTRLNELEVENGSLIIPAILSPSGIPEPAVDQINLHFENRLKGWSIEYARLRFGDARASLNGIIDLDVLPKPDPDAPRKTLSERLVQFHKQANDLKNIVSNARGLEARVTLDAPRNGPQTLAAVVTARDASWKDQANAQTIEVQIQSEIQANLSLNARIAGVSAQPELFAEDIALQADWDTFPNPEQWLPQDVRLSINIGGKETTRATNLLLSATPQDNGDWQARSFFKIVDSAWELSTVGNPENKTARVELRGSPTQGLVDLGIEHFKARVLPHAPDFQKLDVDALVEITDRPDVHVSAQFDGAFMPSEVSASLVVDRISSLHAPFDRVIAQARLDGKTLSVPNLWLRSGPQNGRLSVDLDLETKHRRILIDGLFNPRMIDGWIPEPWWAEVWDNFEFRDEGFHCLMDSAQIIKQPQTLRLTGYGVTEDVVLRGHPMNAIETRMFILQRYIDLYDLDIARDEGYVRGDIQFSLDEDPRDKQFKMTGLWIDAESTIDVSIGPDVISEVRENVAEIIEPYGYEIPPRVRATSSSVRHKDNFDYEVDLQIDSDHAFSYFHYPLDSISAEVFVANDRASIRSVQADLADGVLTANAEVRGEDMDLDVALTDAHFGDTLRASAVYFAANDEESAANTFSPDDLSSYGGIASLTFKGKGIVGDSQSFDGEGTYQISGADFYQLQLFGGLSRAFSNAGLPIATLKFEDADGVYSVEKRYVRFPELRLKGPVAQIKSEGAYDIEEGDLDFRAQLQPFRSVPLLQIASLPLDFFTRIFEVSLTGTISDPDWSLFRGPQKVEEDVSKISGTDSE